MRLLLSAIMLLGCALPALAAGGPGRADEALARSRAALGEALPDVAFTDVDGSRVRLADFRGRPLLVTLVYTGCVDVCPTLIESLYPAVEVAQETFGADAFTVVTVGFDVRQDTPDRMRSLARAHGVALPNWRFLSADGESLDALAAAVGFGFYRRAGGFDHLAQVSIVDARGRLQGQVYGADFSAPQIVEPLKTLIYNREAPLASWQGLVDRVRLFCTTYDPGSGRYRFDYSLFIGLAIGALSLGLVLALIVREWRRPAGGTDGHA